MVLEYNPVGKHKASKLESEAVSLGQLAVLKFAIHFLI
jgi:hypothetical protein